MEIYNCSACGSDYCDRRNCFIRELEKQIESMEEKINKLSRIVDRLTHGIYDLCDKDTERGV